MSKQSGDGSASEEWKVSCFFLAGLEGKYFFNSLIFLTVYVTIIVFNS